MNAELLMYREIIRHTGVCKFSRSGQSVIFSKPVFGRQDVSSDHARAEKQLQAAGVDMSDVDAQTDAQYREWAEKRDYIYAHATDEINIRVYLAEVGHHEEVRCLVSVKHGSEEGFMGLEPKMVFERQIPMREIFTKKAMNRIGRMGAVVAVPDVNALRSAVQEARRQYPGLKITTNPRYDRMAVKCQVLGFDMTGLPHRPAKLLDYLNLSGNVAQYHKPYPTHQTAAFVNYNPSFLKEGQPVIRLVAAAL